LKTPQSKKWEADAPPDTPYRKAQQEWDDRIGSARVQAKNWRFFSFFALGLAALSIIGMIYLGTLPKTVVEYVEVDKKGSATFVGRAGQAAQNYQLSHAQIGFHLRRFLNDTRSLSSDQLVIRENWFDAYKLLAGEATNVLTAYAQSNDPFNRADKERVNVTVESVLQITPDTWQLDWTEELWSPQGALKETQKWRGSFTVARILPDDEAVLRDNPLGLYITAFSWSRID